MNFFRALREDTERLVHLIEFTPFAKAEWELAFTPCEDPVERARRFYVRSFMNIAGPTAQWRSGWRRQKVVTGQDGKKRMTPAPLSFMGVDHLYAIAHRLKGIQIENDKALAVIKRYDSASTLFYLDPPYPEDTRAKWKNKAYAYEMADEEHREMARALDAIQGMVLISGYRCEMYDELYAGWHRVDHVARVNGGGSATESLWLSPRTWDALQSMSGLPLFNQLGT